METIPQITWPMKSKGLRKPLKKGYSVYIVHIVPAKVGFVRVFMIDWINLFCGLSLKYTKECQALLNTIAYVIVILH